MSIYEIKKIKIRRVCGLWVVSYKKYFQGRYAHKTNEFFDIWNQAMIRTYEITRTHNVPG